MTNEQMISELYRAIGTIEGLTTMRGLCTPEPVACVIDDCIDRLELAGGRILGKDMHTDEDTEEDSTIPEDIYNQ